MKLRRSPNPRLMDLVAFLCALGAASWVTAQLGGPPPAAVSPAVYPPNSGMIRFSHARHAAEPCTTCHAAALTSQRAAESLRPTMATCATCHTQSKNAPSLEECSACHVAYPQRATEPVLSAEDWRAVRPAPMVVPAQQAALRFDHAAHVGRLGGERSCADCHDGTPPAMPSMASCMSCHDGTSAPESCATCHPTGSDGKLQAIRQGTDEPLRPTNHGVDFAKRHASVGKADLQECMACHVEQDCASCHNATMAQPFAVHPPGFLTIHAVDARTGAGECTDCHTVQTFCTECHVRADVTAAPPHAPPPRRQFHPPGWLESSAPNNHGVMARRDITECASCHAEQDCISCHIGVNPHPPEFAMTCRKLLAAGGASCAKCHSDAAALRALCP